MTSQTRTVVVVGSIVGALLLAVLIAVIVLIATLNGQADDAAYRACMANMGVGGPGGTSDIQQMADAAEYCSRD